MAIPQTLSPFSSEVPFSCEILFSLPATVQPQRIQVAEATIEIREAIRTVCFVCRTISDGRTGLGSLFAGSDLTSILILFYIY
jgi:hypothetical protein